MIDVEGLQKLTRDELYSVMRDHRGDHQVESKVATELYRRDRQRNFERTRDVPKAWEDVSLDKLQPRQGQSPVIHVLNDVLDGHEPGAYIHGSTGGGKSYLCAGLVNDQVKLGQRAMWVGWLSLLRNQQARIRGDAGELDVMAIARDVDLLVLDDFGTALRASSGGLKVASDFAVTLAEELIDARLANRRQTVITSNLDPARVNAAYGSRVASRLVGLCHAVPLRGPDQRLVRRASASIGGMP